MKLFLEKITKKILLVLVQVHIKRYKPFIIGVTGSVGKTSTREAIKAVVGSRKRIRTAAGSLNNELGFALTILGNWDKEYFDEGSSFGLWLRVFFVGLFGLLFRGSSPEVFVLEYGADRPGDIRKLARAVKPHIAVVTAIGEIPVHVEFFSGSEAVAREKSRLVEALESTDYVVLNSDDDVVLDMKERTRAKVITFGFDEGAGVRISSFEYKTDSNMPVGVTFKLHYGQNSFVPVHINGSLGKSQAWAAAAAAAVGIAMNMNPVRSKMSAFSGSSADHASEASRTSNGMNLVEISDALSYYDGPKGRLKILAGIKNSWVIDDTYNASPASTHLALETLKNIVALRQTQGNTARSIAVLGDMLELGKYSIQAHQAMGDLVGGFVDILVCIGSRAKFIADAAANQMSKENIFAFETSDEAKEKVQELIQEGDLILVKGSQGMRMERIVEEIMAEPQRKKNLLVRQSKKWLSK